MRKLHGIDLFLHVLSLIPNDTDLVGLTADTPEELAKLAIEKDGRTWYPCQSCQNPFPATQEVMFCSDDCFNSAIDELNDWYKNGCK